MKIKNPETPNSNDNFSMLTWQMAIGSTLSWELSKLLGSDHPYLAPLSVILCLHTVIEKTFQISMQRVIGTVIGIFIIILIASNLSINGWSLGLLILLGGLITRLLKLNKTVLHQVSLTILFVFTFEHQSSQYALDRMRDTLVGVITAVLIQLIWFYIILRGKLQNHN